MSRNVVKKGYALKWKCECGPNIVARIEKERRIKLKMASGVE